MKFRLSPLCVAPTLLIGAMASAAGQPVSPPARVGRIASVAGAVSFHLAGASEWQVASRNLPVTTGTALWVAPAGTASIGVAGSRIVLGPSTELDMDQLDDQALAATQPQGESYWHLAAIPGGDTYTLRTPRGTVTVATAGRYEVVSGDTEHPTTVTVLDGAATLTDVPTTQEIGAGQTVTITGDGAATPFAATIGPAAQDEFLRRALAAEAPPPPRPGVAAAPAIVAAMTGSEALAEVGEWTENAEYGPVWYPPAADYVPYRSGRWAYVAPWGWTWVDDASWGFAPSHYGRWAQFDGRWGWVPGRDGAPGGRPVYAPALVGFIGGAALGAGAAGLVGWAPLGPGAPYRPPYAVGGRSDPRPNYGAATTVIDRAAITVVPTQVMTRSASVAAATRPGPLAGIGPAAFEFRPQVAPTRATIGATRDVLQRVHPTGLAAPATHVAPGPALNAPGILASRPAPGAAPLPSIGPAAVLGGAVAGGLLHQPPRPEALPTLRGQGEVPPRIAGPRPPIAPDLLDPGAASGALSGAHPSRDLLTPRAPAPYAAVPRPAAPVRPELPRVRYGGPPVPERTRPMREPFSPPVRQERFAPPRNLAHGPAPQFAPAAHVPAPAARPAPASAPPHNGPPPHAGGGPERHER